MSIIRKLIPKILLPTFTWPHRVLGSVPLASSIPPAPPLVHPIIRRLVGFIHYYLRYYSYHYCAWTGVRYSNQVAPLPFGLVLKWSDGTRLEEVVAMMVMRAAGFPVPKVIAYGEHPDAPHAPVSILMTRLPGNNFGEIYQKLNDEERRNVLIELQTMLQVMRSWPNPWAGENGICSVVGTNIRSIRVPYHKVGPCESETEFNDYLISAASSRTLTPQDFEEKVACARRIRTIQHPIVWTHGDLQHHNIMVHEGHISGFIDWEAAGWYPNYWEFTTPLRFCPKDFWWYQFIWELGGSEYEMELVCEKALSPLTVDSWIY